MKLRNPTHDKYSAALRAWPAAGSGVHGHLMAVANLAAFSGVPEAEGIEAAKAAMPRPPNPPNEVETTFAKAYAERNNGSARESRPRPAPPVKDCLVSLYRNARDNRGEAVGLAAVLDGIRSARWESAVAAVREAVERGDNAAKDAAKRNLPGFTPAGLFAVRRKDGLQTHSGLVVADVDKLPTADDAAKLRDGLALDPHVCAAFVSPSGLGVKALVQVEPCASAAEHEQAFAALVTYYADEFGVNLDTSGRDASRLCFVSHDADAFIREGSAKAFAWRKGEAKADPLAGRKSLADLAEQEIDDRAILLGERFLCRRGAVLFVGRAGLGKSSASVQQDASWACGLPAFGIVPARPLKILTVQAENDEGDLKEMSMGVLVGLGLNEQQIDQVRRNTTVVQWFESGDAFLEKLRAALGAEQDTGTPFDLVRIDPLLAFAGGDLVKPDVVAGFCRSGLNSIAHDYDVGIVAVHHTPKINLTARPRMDGPERIYAATGCADLANWARGSIVITDAGNSTSTFRLIAAKRGKRLGWRNEAGEREFERHFSHAENHGGMYWREATPEEIAAATAKATNDKKPDALQEIALKDTVTMKAHALKILREGPLTASDFKAGIIREFGINSKYANTVAKWLSEGDGKPVKVRKIGKVHWHGTAEQLDALCNPPLKGLK